MSGSLIYLILMIFVLIRFLAAGKKQNKTGNRGTSSSTASKNTSAGRNARNARKASGSGPMAADGHRVPKDQDISCRRYGHNHPEFNTPRFIPHEDPEEGYIILNGVKMKLTEADKYEDRI